MINGAFSDKMKLDKIIIMGISKIIRQVLVNDEEVQFEYDHEKSVSLIKYNFFKKKFKFIIYT